MRGYCPKCKEYRSDNGTDAWQIVWLNGFPICGRCGSMVDVWNYSEKRTKEFMDAFLKIWSIENV